MASFDELRERQRLIQRYGGMSDAELVQVAADPAALTEVAEEVLKEEAQRRGLELPEPPAEEVEVPEFGELVAVRQFRKLPEALVAKGALEAAGIECWLTNENMVRVAWSNLVGGARLCVRETDAERALGVLEQPVAEPPGVEDDY